MLPALLQPCLLISTPEPGVNNPSGGCVRAGSSLTASPGGWGSSGWLGLSPPALGT